MVIKRFSLLIAGLILYNALAAQLCQGSLGDPVVSITFGSGAGFGPPLGAGVTNYNYVTGVCPNDGFYAIGNQVSNCFNGSWHTVTEDHTAGDVNGYMMIVNASYTAGDFYVDTVRGLCGSTTYEFAAWVSNVLRSSACNASGIKPNITFNIESVAGVVLQSYNTSDIAAGSNPSWSQYGLFFTTPSATTSVVVRITNNAPGGCGNDILLDDITFRPCGPKVSVSINGSMGNKIFCSGDLSPLTFTGSSVGGYSNPFYQWQQSTDSITWTDIPGANNNVYSRPAIIAAGSYFFRLAVAPGSNIFIPSCRISSEAVAINVVALPVPQASNTGPGCEQKGITLSASGGGTYAWTGPNNFSGNVQSPVIPAASLSDNGKYFVKVTSAYGCINIDSTIVVINKNPAVNAGIDITVCEGVKTTLLGSTTNATAWSWSPPLGLSDPSNLSPTASPDKTTLYVLTAKNGVCSNADSVIVNVLSKPSANAGPDKAIIGSQFAILEGQATGSNISYYWTPNWYLSPDSSLNPKVSPLYDTAYVLHVVSRDGCGEATDKVLVKHYKEIYIPNAFTPNNDGLNDRWNIPPLAGFAAAEVSVYNRFGQLVFHNNGYTKQWDGTFKGLPQPAGVYCYTIDLNNGLKTVSGFVVLIR